MAISDAVWQDGVMAEALLYLYTSAGSLCLLLIPHMTHSTLGSCIRCAQCSGQLNASIADAKHHRLARQKSWCFKAFSSCSGVLKPLLLQQLLPALPAQDRRACSNILHLMVGSHSCEKPAGLPRVEKGKLAWDALWVCQLAVARDAVSPIETVALCAWQDQSGLAINLQGHVDLVELVFLQ